MLENVGNHPLSHIPPKLNQVVKKHKAVDTVFINSQQYIFGQLCQILILHISCDHSPTMPVSLNMRMSMPSW